MAQILHQFYRPKLFVALFLLLLALAGLCAVRDYGMPFDELTEMQIFQSNLKEYALQWNPDNPGFYAALSVARASESNDREYGSSAYYLLAPFLPRLAGDIAAFSLAWSVLTWVWFMLGCAALYGILRSAGLSRLPACAGMLLLYLMPRFFAEGHYNNKDMVLLSFVLITLYFGVRLMRKPGVLRALVFALSAAIATNTRVVGLAVFGLTGLMVAAGVTVRRQWSRKMAWIACAAVLGYLAFYVLLTPAMWSRPLEQLGYTLRSASSFSRWNGTILFRGALFPDPGGSTPLPFYYLPYMMLTTIPLYTSALALLGLFTLCGRWIQQKGAWLSEPSNLLLLTAALLLVLPVACAVLFRPTVYNGWRHCYFVYAGLVILAGYGIHALAQWTRASKAARAAVAVLLCACLLFTGAGIAYNHPYEFAFYNALVPRDRENYLELDYWNVGFAGAFRQLYGLKQDTGEPLVVGCYFNDISIGAYKLPPDIRSRLTLTADRDAPYLCYNATYACLYRVQEPPEGYHTLFTARSYGRTLLTMYARDAGS